MHVLLVSNHRRFKIHFRAFPWARELTKRGHRVDILCHADTERWRTRIDSSHGFRIIENPDMLVGALRQGWDPYCAWRRKRFLFAENKPYDLIHCLDTRLAVIWPALAYARARDIPIVSDWIDWWGRGGLIRERRPLWYRWLFGGVETWFEEHYRARLDGLTTISEALLERGVALGCARDRAKVIHGGADLDIFADIPSMESCRERLGIAAGAPVVCFSGLDVLIDLPLAIRAFQALRRSKPDARLLLVGPTRDDARRAAGDSTHITATGPVPFADLPNYLAAANVFVMPFTSKVSNVGRWPNKVGDYMAVGRPVVSNPVGEVKWLYERYDIGLLADETPESIARALLELLDDPARAEAMGRRARKYAETDFSWETRIVELEEWYHDILRKLDRSAPMA